MEKILKFIEIFLNLVKILIRIGNKRKNFSKNFKNKIIRFVSKLFEMFFKNTKKF